MSAKSVRTLWNKCVNHPGRDTRSRTGAHCAECIARRYKKQAHKPNGDFAGNPDKVSHHSRGIQNQVHKVFRHVGEQPKGKEALCLTCFGLPHAVEGVYCKARKTDGTVCGQSSEPEVVEVKAQGLKSNFVIDVFE